MIRFMKDHTAYIEKILKQNTIKESVIDYHERQIQRLQHERLCHLLVMLFTLFAFLSLYIVSFVFGRWEIYIACALLLPLSLAYVLHYYRLENTVQYWYKISDDISRKCGMISTVIK